MLSASGSVSIGFMALKSLRFALGTAAHPRSGVWHLWLQEDDVHLDIDTPSLMVAFTAYRTGRWRIAAGDAVSRWTRPKDFRPGWTRGPDLLVPGSVDPLTPVESRINSAGPITWLTPPVSGSLARFTMLFATARSTEHPWRPVDVLGTSEVAVLALRTAGSLYLCRRDEEDDEPEPAVPRVTPPALTVRISADQAGIPSLRESYVA